VSRSSTAARTALALALLTATAACSWAQSDFAKRASDAESTFAAAETTLRLRHEARLTLAYARGSFINYRDALQGLEEELPSLPGAPATDAVEKLAALLREAERAIEDPCLDNDCDWEPQVDLLKRAKDAFAAAAE
jgi:hypothetical protein